MQKCTQWTKSEINVLSEGGSPKYCINKVQWWKCCIVTYSIVSRNKSVVVEVLSYFIILLWINNISKDKFYILHKWTHFGIVDIKVTVNSFVLYVCVLENVTNLLVD